MSINNHLSSPSIDQVTEMLKEHEIRPTSSRILVLTEMLRFVHTFSLIDLEISLGTVDRSTISRAITLFKEHHLLHIIEDGSGFTKYCICHHHNNCSIKDLHVHFYCEVCHTTYCLKDEQIPLLKLKNGFEARSINYMVKGVCPSCKKKGLNL